MGNLEKDFFGIHQSDNFLDGDINGLCQNAQIFTVC